MPVIKVENDASLYGTASAVFMNCDRSFRDFQKVFEALEGKYDHDSLDSIRSSWNRMWDKMRDEVDKLVHIRKAYESERQELEKRTAAHEKELEDVKEERDAYRLACRQAKSDAEQEAVTIARERSKLECERDAAKQAKTQFERQLSFRDEEMKDLKRQVLQLKQEDRRMHEGLRRLLKQEGADMSDTTDMVEPEHSPHPDLVNRQSQTKRQRFSAPVAPQNPANQHEAAVDRNPQAHLEAQHPEATLSQLAETRGGFCQPVLSVGIDELRADVFADQKLWLHHHGSIAGNTGCRLQLT